MGRKKNLNKPSFVKILSFLVLILIISVLARQVSPQNKQPSPINKQKETSQAEKIEISGIKVNDFHKNAVSDNPSAGYTLIVQKNNYHIFYFDPDELFVISILGYPFEEFQSQAEEEFLKTLSVSKDEACKLNVDITTPLRSNPSKAGKIYKLNFCEQIP